MAAKFPNVRTLGVDEAGRGPILGPLVLAAVVVDTAAARALTRAGVADSKAFGAGPDAHTRRAALVPLIFARAASVTVEVVDVVELDRRVLRKELNVLEREVATRLIDRSAPHDKILADGERLFGPLAAAFPALLARDGAESQHVAVAAASVIAKVRRDELFACIARRYEPTFGPVTGGGYLNDATNRFLCAYLERHGHLPPEARRSWQTGPRLQAAFPPGYDPRGELEATHGPQLSLLDAR